MVEVDFGAGEEFVVVVCATLCSLAATRARSRVAVWENWCSILGDGGSGLLLCLLCGVKSWCDWCSRCRSLYVEKSKVGQQS
jgi:predicted naringenin-chalcone synthase